MGWSDDGTSDSCQEAGGVKSSESKPTLLVLASTYPRWVGDPEPGFVHELSKRLCGQFDVTVLCPHASGAQVSESVDGVEVIRYRYAPEVMETLVNDGGIVTNLRRAKWKLLLVPGFVLMQGLAAWRISRNRRFDVIHAHWLLPQGLICALLQRLPGGGKPFLVTSHGADLYALRGKIFGALKRWVIRHADAVTVVSSAMLEKLEELGAPAGKVSVLSMGVDVSSRFRPDATEVRSTREILFVGRLVEKKGVRHLIRAMSLVIQQRPDAFLSIVGFGPDEAGLRTLVEESGLRESVRFLGALPQSELPALYRRAAVFVAPFVRAASGDQEGLGLVLVEAISCDCPVLAGNVPAISEVLGVGFDDMIFDPLDTYAFAAHVVGVLADPESAQKRAEQLRVATGKRFDWEHIAAGYADVLRSILPTG